jgi:hypothetical protein
MIMMIAKGLGLNKWLMLHQWISLRHAVTLQSLLMQWVAAEQKHLCKAHMQVLVECFATGELESTPEILDYFEDLRVLQHEGRYETVLSQIYQLDRKAVQGLRE